MAVGGLGLALAACGSSGDGRSDEAAATSQAADPAVVPADLDGSTFTSTEVVGHDLVPGTEVTLEFDQGTMSVAAGCNTQFGAYELDGDVLRWAADPASSMVGCEPALAQQDAWLADFFTAGARVTPDDRGLTLTADGVTLAMVGEGEADLAALLGTRWDLVGTVANGDPDPVPTGRRTPGLVVGPHGVATVDTGCNTGRSRVRVAGDTLELGPTTVTRLVCNPPWRGIERRMLAVLDGTTDSVLSDASVLVVTRQGRSLVFGVE